MCPMVVMFYGLSLQHHQQYHNRYYFHMFYAVTHPLFVPVTVHEKASLELYEYLQLYKRAYSSRSLSCSRGSAYNTKQSLKRSQDGGEHNG